MTEPESGRFPGSIEDLEAFVNDYRMLVYSVAHSHLHRRGDVDDVVQCTFIHAYSRYDQLRNREQPGQWLCGVARNLARQINRRYNREVPFEDQSLLGGIRNDDEIVDNRNVLLQGIGSLSITLREPLLLYYLGDRTVAEIAGILSIPVGTVKRRLHEARRKLRMELNYGMSDGKIDIKASDLGKRLELVLKAVRDELRDGNVLRVSEMCNEAIALAGDNPPDGDPMIMLYRIYNIKANALRQSVGTAAAIEYDYKRIALLERMEGPDAVESMVMALESLGISLSDLDRPDEALENLAKAYRVARNGGLFHKFARVLYWTAVIKNKAAKDDYGLSELEEANRYLSECRDEYDPTISALVMGTYKAVGSTLDSFRSNRHAYVAPSASYLEIGNGIIRVGEGPGFSNGNGIIHGLPDHVLVTDLFLHHSGRCRILLDDSWNVGGSYGVTCPTATRNPLDAAITLISMEESISVSAGQFSNCLHTELEIRSQDDDPSSDGAVINRSYCGTVDTWYAPNVGIVKVVVSTPAGISRLYELNDYSASADTGGTGLCRRFLPLVPGNRWSYSVSGEEVDIYLNLVNYKNQLEVVKVGDATGEPYATVSHCAHVVAG